MNKTIKNIVQSIGTIAVVAGVILWQTGYNPFKSSGTVGEVVTTDVFKTMKTQKENDGKRIAVIGTFSVSNIDLTIRMGKPTSLSFADTGDHLVDHFNLYNGTGANEFFLPAKFTPSDLKIYDNAENMHSFDEKVKLSFTMKRIKEAEPEKNPLTGAYAWEYDQIRIDPVN